MLADVISTKNIGDIPVSMKVVKKILATTSNKPPKAFHILASKSYLTIKMIEKHPILNIERNISKNVTKSLDIFLYRYIFATKFPSEPILHTYRSLGRY